MTADFLKSKFEAGFDYDRYVQTGNPQQQQRWNQVYAACALTASQTALVKSFQRQMHLLVSSGIWCGAGVQQVPLIARIAQTNPQRLALRIVDRDQHRDLAEQIRINGGDRVPVVLMLSEDFEFCSLLGDRTLARYRALAARQLGPSCALGVSLPPAEELAATLADWLGEIERVQLMLRLSPRLRERHAD